MGRRFEKPPQSPAGVIKSLNTPPTTTTTHRLSNRPITTHGPQLTSTSLIGPHGFCLRMCVCVHCAFECIDHASAHVSVSVIWCVSVTFPMEVYGGSGVTLVKRGALFDLAGRPAQTKQPSKVVGADRLCVCVCRNKCPHPCSSASLHRHS